MAAVQGNCSLTCTVVLYNGIVEQNNADLSLDGGLKEDRAMLHLRIWI